MANDTIPQQWRPRALSAAIVMICIGMSGVQLWRADVKNRDHVARLEGLASRPTVLARSHRRPADVPTAKAIAHGKWIPEKGFLLDNRTLDGKAGYHVVMPFQLTDGAIVLVNRGWIAAPALRSQLPALPPPSPGRAGQGIEGWVVPFDASGFQLGDGQPRGIVWPFLRHETYTRASGLTPQELLVLQADSPEIRDGLARPWTTPQASNPAIKHLGYAAMWLFFALLGFLHARWNARAGQQGA